MDLNRFIDLLIAELRTIKTPASNPWVTFAIQGVAAAVESARDKAKAETPSAQVEELCNETIIVNNPTLQQMMLVCQMAKGHKDCCHYDSRRKIGWGEGKLPNDAQAELVRSGASVFISEQNGTEPKSEPASPIADPSPRTAAWKRIVDMARDWENENVPRVTWTAKYGEPNDGAIEKAILAYDVMPEDGYNYAKALEECSGELNAATLRIADRDKQIAKQNGLLATRENEIMQLTQQIVELKSQLAQSIEREDITKGLLTLQLEKNKPQCTERCAAIEKAARNAVPALRNSPLGRTDMHHALTQIEFAIALPKPSPLTPGKMEKLNKIFAKYNKPHYVGCKCDTCQVKAILAEPDAELPATPKPATTRDVKGGGK